MAHAHTDPLDQLAALGIRVTWLPDSGGEVSYAPDLRVVIADPTVCRREIARLALEMWGDESGSGLDHAS